MQNPPPLKPHIHWKNIFYEKPGFRPRPMSENKEQGFLNFFNWGVCHFCKEPGTILKSCTQCKIVRYCSREHQKEDWKTHKDFCKALTDVLQKYKHTTETRLQYDGNVKMICEKKLNRPLRLEEAGMITFRPKCSYCMTTTDHKIRSCAKCCSFATCVEHMAKYAEHEAHCEKLKTSLDVSLMKWHKLFHYPSLDFRSEATSFDYKTMDEFIVRNMLEFNNFKLKHPQETILHKCIISDWLTMPLTLLTAFKILGIKPGPNFVVHIVGSTARETRQKWDIPDHPYAKFEFIGLEDERSNTSYHDYTGPKPDLIAAFNCGFAEYEGARPELDTWKESLPRILSRRVPIVLTSYTENEAIADVARLTKLQSGLRVRRMVNPFASLTPFRDIEGLGVYYDNHYLSIITFGDGTDETPINEFANLNLK